MVQPSEAKRTTQVLKQAQNCTKMGEFDSSLYLNQRFLNILSLIQCNLRRERYLIFLLI